MAVILGPVLGFQGAEPKIWRVSVLIVVDDGATPKVKLDAAAGVNVPAPVQLASFDGSRVLRTDLALPIGPTGKSFTYSIENEPESWTIHVPAGNENPRMAYASCNGFSSIKLKKSFKREAFPVWKQMGREHAKTPFHLLLLGGDQIYADLVWERSEFLRTWLDKPMDKAQGDAVPPAELAALRKAYLKEYSACWGPSPARETLAPVRNTLASVPTIMMWDDHDIIDGWGSYPKARQQSRVFDEMFGIARDYFACLQRQLPAGKAPADKFYLAPTEGFSFLHKIGSLAILGMDLRSQRTMDRVLTPKHWDAVFAAIDGLTSECKHLVVMSSIPVVHADFTSVEALLGTFPGQQELEDDLRDHWSSRAHQEERMRLVHRLLDFSRSKKSRVTIVAGDVHVGALGIIKSTRDSSAGSASVITQLTSSGIVHPEPPATMLFALENLFSTNDDIDRDISASMERIPTTKSHFIGGRNFLTLETERGGKDCMWAKWYVEGEEQPYTKVIHPV